MNHPMKRRRILLLLALGAVGAGLFLFWLRGPKEPVYQGKRLSQWIEEADRTDSNEQAIARKAIGTLGTNALPWLMSEFKRPPPKLRNAFYRWVARNTSWDFRSRRHEQRIRLASHGIHFLGSNAAPALPTLFTYLADPERGSRAAHAMAGAGELSLPYMLQAVSSTNRDLAYVGTWALIQLARNTESAIPHLVNMMNHRDFLVRNEALRGLILVDLRPDLTLPPIVQATADADQRIRVYAADLLKNVKAEGKPAVPALQRLMTNSDPIIASAASNTIFRIDPSAVTPPMP